MARALLAALSAIAVAACASSASQLGSKLSSIPDNARSYVVGTYIVDCKVLRSDLCVQQFNAISAKYRSMSDRTVFDEMKFVHGSMFGGDVQPDQVDYSQGRKISHFCLVLPPGRYEFYSLNYYQFGGGGSGYSVGEKDEFSVPFEARAGYVTDIGSVHVTTAQGRNMLGGPAYGPGVMQLSPPTPSGTQLALAKCPTAAKQMPVAVVRLQVPDGRSTPFVRDAMP